MGHGPEILPPDRPPERLPEEEDVREAVGKRSDVVIAGELRADESGRRAHLADLRERGVHHQGGRPQSGRDVLRRERGSAGDHHGRREGGGSHADKHGHVLRRDGAAGEQPANGQRLRGQQGQGRFSGEGVFRETAGTLPGCHETEHCLLQEEHLISPCDAI